MEEKSHILARRTVKPCRYIMDSDSDHEAGKLKIIGVLSKRLRKKIRRSMTVLNESSPCVHSKGQKTKQRERKN